MGHPPPQPVAPAGIPSLKWPLIWLALSGYLVVASFIDFTIDREADAAEALKMFPICIGFFIAALAWLNKRIEQREDWREQRFRNALDKPWPAPETPDWEAFEYDVAVQLQDGDTNGDGALRTVRHDRAGA